DAGLAETLKTSYYKPGFMDELLDERSRELCGEGWRRIDLIRTARMTTVIANLKTPSVEPAAPDYYLNKPQDAPLGKYYYWNAYTIQPVVDNFAPYKIWYPIPKGEKSVNPNLEQNPGY
ncbi:MAG: RagB/SusD family nutrient uptake outer membrane protein, partial [Tannerella sp.]|nr:RagB/SusD family nutrient uptake outer membrane protein [Tannerella sp.]